MERNRRTALVEATCMAERGRVKALGRLLIIGLLNSVRSMSALHPIATETRTSLEVRVGPDADILTTSAATLQINDGISEAGRGGLNR